MHTVALLAGRRSPTRTGEGFTREVTNMFDFANNKVVKALDTVPEEFRALYKELEGEDGGFGLKDDDTTKGAVSAIIGLGTALKASRAEAKANKGSKVDLSPLAEYGEGIEEIAAGFKTKMEELQGQIKGGKDATINLEKIKKDLAAGHATEMEVQNKRAKALSSQLYNILVQREALEAMGDSVINPKLAMPFIENQLQTIEEDGKFRVVVVDEAGDRRFSGVTGNEMTIKELVKDMRTQDDFAPLFKSEVKSGSHAKPGVSAGVPTRRPEGRELSSVEKIAAGLRAKKN